VLCLDVLYKFVDGIDIDSSSIAITGLWDYKKFFTVVLFGVLDDKITILNIS